MQIKLIFSALLLASSVTFAQAKKEALVIGAGGEPPEADGTIFDSTYVGLMTNLNAGKWQTSSYFDGGHATSAQIADSMTNYSNKSFGAKEAQAEIDGYIKRIESGDLKKGDQLLVSVMTHGWQKTEKESTHLISTTDGTMSLDGLEKLRDIAEAKGVKLAIMDLSCYSGNTLKLATAKTCVISLATDDNVGYPVKSADVVSAMKPGTNLEVAFLNGRASKSSLSPGQMQIGTAAGKKTMEDIKFLQYSMQDAGNMKNEKCLIESNSFKKILGHVKELNQSLARENPTGIELQDAVTKYNTHKEKVFTTQMAIAERGKKPTCIKYQDGTPSCLPLSNFEKVWNNTPGLLNDEEKRLYSEVRSSEEFLSWKKMNDDYQADLKRLNVLAKDVSAAEQKIYEITYRKHSKNNKTPNPCRAFKL